MNMNSASFNGFHRFPLVSYELHKMETAENRAVGGFQPYGFLVSSFFLLFKRKEKERIERIEERRNSRFYRNQETRTVKPMRLLTMRGFS